MPFPLFSRFGVELEYMVVDRATLAVRPMVDVLLQQASKLPGAVVETEGDPAFPNQVELGDIAWSNELALHVLEFKTSQPAPSFTGVAERFHEHVRRANFLLEPYGCMLLPGGAHPLMNPDTEMKLWPHDYSPVYQAFNRIHDCRGHGWANLQSAHLNLPFDGDEGPDSEFGRLHAAIRVLLPILAALSASSPLLDGKRSGLMDTRLEVYRTNSRKIPAATGQVIPEPVFTRADYERVVLGPIYDQYAPLDRDGLLRHEWANSRGAIARFMRSAIEIRVLDVQEAPRMDLAIVAGISSVLEAMTAGRLGSLDLFRTLPVEPLHRILLDVIKDADAAVVSDPLYLKALGQPPMPTPTRELWRSLLEAASGSSSITLTPFRGDLDLILREGPLARRMDRALGAEASPAAITNLLRQMAACLAENRPLLDAS